MSGTVFEGVHVQLACLRINPTNPRRQMDAAALASLTESVKREGILQPLLVRPVADSPANLLFEIVAGERRDEIGTDEEDWFPCPRFAYREPQLSAT